MSNYNPYEPSKPTGPYPPMGAPQKPVGEKPKNYLVESILLLLCCAGLFGIPAIVFAAQVDSKWNKGDYQGAIHSSNEAKKWCTIGFCIGLFCNVIAFALNFMIEAQNF